VVRNPFYQVAELRRYARAIGWPEALRLRYWDFKVRTGISRPAFLEVKLKNAKFPLLMRTRASDRDVLWQVFIQGEYEPVKLSNPKVIIDLGANVGYSAAFFLSKYPTATVLAVEPDPDNYAICCRNLAPYGERAKVIQGAVWPERVTLVLDKGTFGDGRDWATRVRTATESARSHGDPEINGYDVETLIGLCASPEVDLLKIDIETSELELFSRNTERWLPHVKNLCIELHGQECQDVFFRAISSYSYVEHQSNGVTVCQNLQARG
jgi:FkbM family methyltransferase